MSIDVSIKRLFTVAFRTHLTNLSKGNHHLSVKRLPNKTSFHTSIEDQSEADPKSKAIKSWL
jgi:hypothetical protein